MDKSAILFSKEHVRSVEFEHRLPPTSIGARRMRPSSKAVLKELRRMKRSKKEKRNDENASNSASISAIANKEFKDSKASASTGAGTTSDKNGGIVSIEQEQEQGNKDGFFLKSETQIVSDNAAEKNINDGGRDDGTQNTDASTGKDYFQLKVDTQTVQEEVDEITGADRSAYNNLPVLLTPAMTRQALRKNLISVPPSQSSSVDVNVNVNLNVNLDDYTNIKIDDDIASKWAKALQESMKVAEDIRAKDDMRPMAYRLVPEAWKRMRPTTSLTKESSHLGACDHMDPSKKETLACQSQTLGDGNKGKAEAEAATSGIQNDNSNEEEMDSSVLCSHKIIFTNNIRNESQSQKVQKVDDDITQQYNRTHDVIYECMYNQFQNIHISCGSKFGCDYLLYDGNRKERHAFAGMRICPLKLQKCKPKKQQPSSVSIGEDDEHLNMNMDDDFNFPLPTSYDMHGFVRSMNTAGKLALLGTVMEGNFDADSRQWMDHKVLFIDLALEKILGAPTHVKKRKRGQVRKEVGQNLAKPN